MNKREILIIGKNYLTVLGVVRSLDTSQYDLDLLYIGENIPLANVAGCSSYIRETIYITSRDDELIIQTILKKYSEREEKILLIPTDDYSLSLIDKYRKNIEMFFVLPLVNANLEGSINALLDKSVQGKIAEESGFNVAKSWVVDLGQSEEELPEDIVFPCFIKPLISSKGYKKEIGVCNTNDELKEKLIQLRNVNSNRSVLVQEFLNITQEYSTGGVCIDGIVYIPGAVKKKCVAKHNIGVTLCGEMVPIEMLGRAKEHMVGLMERLQYTGLFDIEIIQCGDKIYFGELNFRCSSFIGAISVAGSNLPMMYARYMIDGVMEKAGNLKYGMTFVNDKVCWEDYLNRKISRKVMKEQMQSADFTLLNSKEDPTPEKMFMKYMGRIDRKIRIRSFIKKIIPYNQIKKLREKVK